MSRSLGLPWLLTMLLGPPAALAEGPTRALSVGGSLTVASDYIYRGVSSSNNNPAFQADLHAGVGGTFLGVWGSTRDGGLEPYADYELEIYLGHRFDLGDAWSVVLSGRAHYLLGGSQESSDDYQELSAQLSWLDAWTFAITAIPSAPRYWFYERLSRAPAFIAETTGQWLIYHGLYITAGAGYYRVTGTGPGAESADGYAYGNLGLAWEHRHWRIEAGYYLTGDRAEVLMPYPSANQRWAGSVTWRF
ncbi:MAG TPA: TorF family putative porin [Steroidobacteraceae bacterium]|nr:TorF family putative porin [Steroidobacteraceae bacterium]